MKTFRLILLATLLAVAPATSRASSTDTVGEGSSDAKVPVEIPEHQPVVLEIERLFRLQDATAMGVRTSVADQKKAILTVSEMLRHLPAAPSAQLVYYTVAYVLSGGDPNSARWLSEAFGLDTHQRKFLEASAYFMTGDRERASDIFRQIKLESLPAVLRGRLALALALIERDSPENHQRYLAKAIASMPGTLIEESSLRRSALAYAESQDEHLFWDRLHRYERRFRRSIFASRFREETIDALVVWFSKDKPPSLLRTDYMLVSLPISERRLSYLYLARRAALAGEIALTEFAARRLRRISAEGSPDDTIAKLYESLFAIVASGGEIAAEKLNSVERHYLTESDLILLDAALAVEAEINAPLEDSSSLQANGEQTPLEEQGARLLNDTASLLQSARL